MSVLSANTRIIDILHNNGLTVGRESASHHQKTVTRLTGGERENLKQRLALQSTVTDGYLCVN